MKINDNIAYRCTSCGRVTFPKRVVCLECKGRDFEKIPFTKEGTLMTSSDIYQLPWGINDRYLTIGICQFDNGVKAMGRVTKKDVQKGTRMQAKWEKFREMAGEDVYGWIFEPMT